MAESESGQDDREWQIDYLRGKGVSEDYIELLKRNLDGPMFWATLGPVADEWLPVIKRYTEPDDKQSIIRLGWALRAACDFLPSLDHADIETCSRSPLGVAFGLRQYGLLCEVLAELPDELVRLLEPGKDQRLGFLTESESKCLLEIRKKATLVRRQLEQLRSEVEAQGYEFKDDATIVLKSTGGTPEKLRNQIIRAVFRVLSDSTPSGLHGNPAEVQEDIRTLLEPFFGKIRREEVRNAIDNLLRRPARDQSRSSPGSADS